MTQYKYVRMFYPHADMFLGEMVAEGWSIDHLTPDPRDSDFAHVIFVRRVEMQRPVKPLNGTKTEEWVHVDVIRSLYQMVAESHTPSATTLKDRVLKKITQIIDAK